MTVTLTIPAPGKWITSNASTNRGWRHRHELVKVWRTATGIHAKGAHIAPFVVPVRITGTIHRANRILWDTDGAMTTIKAAVDGLRDVGVLAGDDWRYVLATTSEWGEPDKANPRLVLTIEET